MGPRSAERRARRGRVLSLAGFPLLAAAAAIVRWPPAFVEHAYTNGAYPRIQPVLTSASNQVPFAWLDLIVAIAVVAIAVRTIVTWRRSGRVATWLLGRVWASFRLAAVVYLVFLAAWGCNYQRVPARTRFEVDVSRVSPERLRLLTRRAVREVNALYPMRERAPLDWSSTQARLTPAFEAALRATGTRWTVVPGRPKHGLIPRTFPWAAVDGMVNPFGLEVLVNPEVLPFERPFVLAHEWSHLAGHADESDASFVGFMACLEGPPEVRYSGWLAMLLHAARGLPAADRAEGLEPLGGGPRRDVNAIATRLARARPAVQAVSWRVYDEYLRANGVQAGIASYDDVVQLVLGARLTADLAAPDLSDSTSKPRQ